MGQDDSGELLRQALRNIQLMPQTTDVGRSAWVQQADGQWVRAADADVTRQALAGEESQALPDDDDHIA